MRAWSSFSAAGGITSIPALDQALGETWLPADQVGEVTIEIRSAGFHGFQRVKAGVDLGRLLMIQQLARGTKGNMQPLSRRHVAHQQQTDAFAPAATLAQSGETRGFDDLHRNAETHIRVGPGGRWFETRNL